MRVVGLLVFPPSLDRSQRFAHKFGPTEDDNTSTRPTYLSFRRQFSPLILGENAPPVKNENFPRDGYKNRSRTASQGSFFFPRSREVLLIVFTWRCKRSAFPEEQCCWNKKEMRQNLTLPRAGAYFKRNKKEAHNKNCAPKRRPRR